jgi:hypothetical protein
MSNAEKIRELETIIKYISTFDIERYNRWVTSSSKIFASYPFIDITIQGLGKLDAKLIIEDENIVKRKEPSNPFGDVSEHFTLSNLWVLGAYEVIRTLDQRADKYANFFPEFKVEIKELKFKFARLRMPLAKFEPERHFTKTDSDVAYPGFHLELGASWQLAENAWINRRTLSDGMLSLFETMGA